MGFLKSLKKIAGFSPYTGFGAVNNLSSRGGSSNPFGSIAAAAGVTTPAMRGEAKELASEMDAAAAAAARQAEYEASARAGLERLALRRRKGFMSSILVDPGTALGSSSTLGA